MTPDEQKLLADLAAKIAQTPAPAHDPEAENFIRTHIGNRPDALYLMTQTVLIQNMALDQAQQQIQHLQQTANAGAAAPAQGGSFLGGVGRPAAAPAPGYAPTHYAPAGYGQGYAPPPPPQYAPMPAQPGGGSSFLRSAATTAAGVAGGMLAFEGVSSLIGGLTHGFGGGGFGGFGGGHGFLGVGSGETIIENNYYGATGGEDRGGGSAGGDDLVASNDAQDFSDSGTNVDDSGSFDDGGGFDDGGSGGGDDLV